MKSVLISSLFYNQLASSKRFVNSLLKNTNPEIYDLAIFDNGSTDDTSEYCDLLSKESFIKTYRSEVNLGFAAGHNYIIKKHLDSYKYFVLCNNDIVVPESWLEKLIENSVGVDILAPINEIRGNSILGGRLMNAKGKGQYVSIYDFQIPDWLQFSCVLIKREVFEKIGFLDEEFFAYYEDVDYCLRAKEVGLKIDNSPDVTIEHFDGITSKFLMDKEKILDRSRKYFCEKWKSYLDNL